MSVTLETNRLVLRRPNLSDLEPYLSMFGDERVGRFMSVDGKPMSRFAVWQGLCGAIGHWELRGYGLFTVIGSLASVLLGIAIGFQATILVAVGLYVVAFAAFAALRHAVRARAPEAAPAMVPVDVPVAVT